MFFLSASGQTLILTSSIPRQRKMVIRDSGWTDRQSTSFTLPGGTEASNASGIDNTGLDLYWITDRNTGAQDNGAAVTSTIGQGIYQGSFQISSAGVVSFNVTAVPEPSRALLAGLGLAGIALAADPSGG